MQVHGGDPVIVGPATAFPAAETVVSPVPVILIRMPAHGAFLAGIRRLEFSSQVQQFRIIDFIRGHESQTLSGSFVQFIHLTLYIFIAIL